jgi:hypothetical protein
MIPSVAQINTHEELHGFRNWLTSKAIELDRMNRIMRIIFVFITFLMKGMKPIPLAAEIIRSLCD